MAGFKEEKQKKGSQMRITEDEIDLLKRTFKGNEKLLKLLRKVFLPELDPEVPLNQNIDLWLSLPIEQMSNEEAIVKILARNQLIRHVEMQLMQLEVMANTEAKSPEEIREQMEKDSAK